MIDPARILDADPPTPEALRLIDEFVSPRGAGRRYLFGRNEHAAALARAFAIDGFVDDFAGGAASWMEKPVVAGDTVPARAIIVNCVLCNRPAAARRRIREIGARGTLDYRDFCIAFPERVPLPGFVAEMRAELGRNADAWKALDSSLADDLSRQVLADVVAFRLSGNYAWMAAYAYRPQDQYFDECLRFGTREVFVDAGGYDGDTTERFIGRCPDYERVFLFEPSAANLSRAQVRLAGQRSLDLIPLGLSDAPGRLSFDPNGGPASSVSETGPGWIEATTLDRHIEGKTTFIKMDLEGWELKALHGGRRHVLEDRPKLAIAVYHHAADFCRIPAFVTGLRQDYSVHLRQYSEGWSETVMYFSPCGEITR